MFLLFELSGHQRYYRLVLQNIISGTFFFQHRDLLWVFAQDIPVGLWVMYTFVKKLHEDVLVV